ncbi:HlyD family efflux transporter periplasmic adaptor subunit [Sporosarcina luteola]|uniref:HlyD family efflux transporter periplasmic adaptor subunit n=1 Tax=Sporosarcina luteola TaxID=582850 RepID=UPI00203A7362|nr:HlyD family efflux transporter periplasmic adaptor subunit [Sporosarcina luteola]MCM3744142.1 HlyD family efflux transporter periplasmic adaptor subunit [Sporosarcina luteola]
MNKRLSITVAVIVSLFIAVNVHVLFSKKSTVPKTLYVHKYERMTPGHYEEELPKEGLVTPESIYTVYVGDDETIDSWLVKEGDPVKVGDEIALLQTGRAESQLAAWEAEEEGLLEQRSAIESTIASLESDRSSARTNSSNVTTTETPEGSDVELNVDVQVDVHQDGAYAQAIAEAERELSEIDRKLTVVQTQLEQDDARPALISPVDGTVSDVNKHGFTLAADIYSNRKLVTTYVQLDEWQKIEAGDPVRIQEDNLESVIEGTIHSVSEVPATDSRWREAYDKLDPKERENPLDLYEITIKPLEELYNMPFGANVNASIIVNEAEAVSVKLHWLESFIEDSAVVWKLDEQGRAANTNVTVPFITNNRAVITEGLTTGDVAIYNRNIEEYSNHPRVFLPLPLELPSRSDWRTFGWKNYVKYVFVE